MPIPLHKLANVNRLVKNPFMSTQEIDALRVAGDRVERGEIKQLPPDIVDALKEECWRSIAEIFCREQIRVLDKSRSSEAFAQVKKNSVNQATLLLREFGVEVTRENLLEFFTQVARHNHNPPLFVILEQLKRQYS